MKRSGQLSANFSSLCFSTIHPGQSRRHASCGPLQCTHWIVVLLHSFVLCFPPHFPRAGFVSDGEKVFFLLCYWHLVWRTLALVTLAGLR